MKHHVILRMMVTLSALFFLNILAFSDSKVTAESLKATSTDDKISYVIGYDVS